MALFLDPINVFEPTGNGTYLVKDLEDIPEEIRRCITKIKCKTRSTGNDTTETVIEIEFMSKDAALQAAMKHLGLVEVDGTQVNVNVAGNILSTLLTEVEQNKLVIDTDFIESKARSNR
jgi:hypothetical protein